MPVGISCLSEFRDPSWSTAITHFQHPRLDLSSCTSDSCHTKKSEGIQVFLEPLFLHFIPHSLRLENTFPATVKKVGFRHTNHALFGLCEYIIFCSSLGAGFCNPHVSTSVEWLCSLQTLSKPYLLFTAGMPLQLQQ